MKTLCRIAASAAALALFLECGCSQKQSVTSQHEQTEITLSWWGNDNRTEYTLQAVQLFETQHPEIKVKCSYSEWSGYEARSRIRMVSDTEADVMQINVGWLDQFSADGSGYYDLNKVSDFLDLSNFPEDILRFGTRNNVLNAIPIAMNAETVYINKTIFNKYGLDVPKTWDDMFDCAKVLSKDNIYPLSGASKAVWLYAITYTEQSTGVSFLDEKNNFAFTPAEWEVAIDFYIRMVNEKVIPQIENFKKVNIEKGEYAGSIAWVSDAINYFGTSINNGDEVVAADYTAFSPDESGAGWYEKPATLYAISKNTVHPREAALLLDFMLNSSDMALLQGVEKGIPISKSALGHLDKAGMLSGLQYEASEVMNSNTRLREMNPVLENNDMINDFIDACNLVLYDKSSLEDAAAELCKSINENYSAN
ncbi:MAG: carbohydrate ABC transporter substrate-binding protein [Ruminococcus sp.]|nr:carbohydrate ABC transporter substrate-binding protein [Ruminococcus sp.]